MINDITFGLCVREKTESSDYWVELKRAVDQKETLLLSSSCVLCGNAKIWTKCC